MVYLGRPYYLKFCKARFPQILLGSFLNSLTQICIVVCVCVCVVFFLIFFLFEVGFNKFVAECILTNAFSKLYIFWASF